MVLPKSKQRFSSWSTMTPTSRESVFTYATLFTALIGMYACKQMAALSS